MAEHVALDLEVDAFLHLIEVSLKDADLCLWTVVQDFQRKLFDEDVLLVEFRLEQAGGNHLHPVDSYVLAGEDGATLRSLVELRNLHCSAAAERVIGSRSAHVALEGGRDVAVLPNEAVDGSFVERGRRNFRETAELNGVGIVAS